jgi:hypothetical protein
MLAVTFHFSVPQVQLTAYNTSSKPINVSIVNLLLCSPIISYYTADIIVPLLLIS